MKPFAMVVPENVTTRTTKRVLENGLVVTFTHWLNTHRMSIRKKAASVKGKCLLSRLGANIIHGWLLSDLFAYYLTFGGQSLYTHRMTSRLL
jgi:hypothetical protein